MADLVERSCARARALAQGLAELPGCEILNDVVLNQVLLRFEDDEATDSILAAVQASGEADERHDQKRPQGDPPVRLELEDE